jgi:hypothetical protein
MQCGSATFADAIVRAGGSVAVPPAFAERPSHVPFAWGLSVSNGYHDGRHASLLHWSRDVYLESASLSVTRFPGRSTVE